MKNVLRFVSLAFVVTALSGFVFASANAAPLFTNQDDCVSNGGRWIHFGATDGLNGYCILPVGNPITLSACSNDNEALEQFYSGGSLSSESCFTADGSDGNSATGCQFTLGGTYVPTSTGGTCTVTHSYIGDCPGQTTVYEYDNLSNLLGFTCSSGGGGGSSGPKNFFKGFVSSDEAGIFNFLPPKNGDFVYYAGTCSGKCILSPNLPLRAAETLPDGAIAKLYVRMVDEDGQPAQGSYVVCFNLAGLTNPIIYRYVAGAWAAQPITVGGGKVCTNAGGDGAFALGGS